MPDSFNGYHVWLGIPPSEQPPNHYRLLGITIFETDLDVIDHAADRQMAHVRTFQSGRHGGLSQQILNELAAARVCLLHPERKAEYDESLRAKLATAPQLAVPVGKAVPVTPVVSPRDAPQARPVLPAGKPVLPTANPVEPVEDDEAYDVEEVDLERLAAAPADDGESYAPSGDLISAGPTIKVRRSVRRGVDTDASLQRMLTYTFVAVASVVVIMVLFTMVRRMAGGVNWRDWFSMPEEAVEELVEPSEGTKKPQAPPPPTPGASSAAEQPNG